MVARRDCSRILWDPRKTISRKLVAALALVVLTTTSPVKAEILAGRTVTTEK